MKKIVWSTLLVFCISITLNAQETIHTNENEKITFKPKNIIKVYPLAALVGAIGIGYERAINNKKSLNFNLIQRFNEPNFDNNYFGKNIIDQGFLEVGDYDIVLDTFHKKSLRLTPDVVIRFNF